MTLTVNLRKMLHRKSAEYCAPNPAGNTAAGAFIVADKTSAMPGNDGIVYFGGASAVWQYNADEDAWMQAPNSGIAGTFGAGACGALHAVFAPAGSDRSTATAGTTTTLTTSLTACAATCPTPEPVSQRLPSPPSVSTPIPSVTYTESAKQNSQKRRQRLQATQVMSK